MYFPFFFRKYVPQLSKYPTAYIYEPWKAPLKVQEKAGCIVGKDYPKPIVEHDKIRKKNIERMAQAYNASKTEGGGTEIMITLQSNNVLYCYC